MPGIASVTVATVRRSMRRTVINDAVPSAAVMTTSVVQVSVIFWAIVIGGFEYLLKALSPANYLSLRPERGGDQRIGNSTNLSVQAFFVLFPALSFTFTSAPATFRLN